MEIRRRAPWELTEYQRIRTWQQAMRIVERLLELEWAGRALTYRAILRAIGAAAQMSGSTTIEFGTRQLAMAGGIDHTTVSRALRELRTGPYALIDLVRDANGTRADLYQLVVPDAVAADAAWRSWRPGRIEAIHPAFHEFGLPAAFAYEALSSVEMTAAELTVAALLPRSTTYDALRTLASHALAERGPDGGWRRGPADLDAIAAATGADELAAAQLAGHRADRAQWHAFLGIVHPDQDQGPGNVVAREEEHDAAGPRPADQRRSKRRGPGRRRGGLRLAPPWLTAPPRQRPVTETDLDRPDDIDAALNTLNQQLLPGDWTLPPDVAAAIHHDHQADLADQPAPGQDAEYAAVQAEFRALRDHAGAPRPPP